MYRMYSMAWSWIWGVEPSSLASGSIKILPKIIIRMPIPQAQITAIWNTCAAFSFSFRPRWPETSTPAPEATNMARAIRISISGTETAAAAMESVPRRWPMKMPSTIV